MAAHVGKSDVTETVGDVSGTATVGKLYVAVVIADQKVASNVARLHTSKRSGDVRRGGIDQQNRAVASGDGCGALNVSRGNASKPIVNFECTFDIGSLHRPVVVIDSHTSCSPHELNASERVEQPSSPGIVDRK